MITPEARERLASRMDDRRLELNLRWRDVAEAGGVSYEVLRDVRNGTGGIRRLTEHAIETALRWKAGSVGAILAGGEPAPDENPAPPAALPPGPGLTGFPPVPDEMLRRIAIHLPGLEERLEVVRGMNPGGRITGAMMFPANQPDPAVRERNRLDAWRWDKVAEIWQNPESIAMGVAVMREDAKLAQTEHNRRTGLPAAPHISPLASCQAPKAGATKTALSTSLRDRTVDAGEHHRDATMAV